MTFAETLNEEACSCGLDEGCTWFADNNGNEPEMVGEYRLLRNNNGVRVEYEDGLLLVAAVGLDDKQYWARFVERTWEDV